MIAEENQGIPLYGFERISRLEGVLVKVATRGGGVSPPPFDSLDLGAPADEPGNIAQNLERLRRALGLSELAYNTQVHGVELIAVNGGEASPLAQADGLMCDRPGVGLLVKQADCQSVVLVAPGKAVANLHVGWRGNVAGFPQKGVAAFCRRYGLDPGELHAAVSPGLGPCCAEFVNYKDEFPEALWRYRGEGNRFDLWRMSFDQLAEAGVRPERIEIAGMCSKCRPEFFSYRREEPTGRGGTVAALLPPGAGEAAA